MGRLSLGAQVVDQARQHLGQLPGGCTGGHTQLRGHLRQGATAQHLRQLLGVQQAARRLRGERAEDDAGETP